MPTYAASSTRSTTSGCCGWWHTGSPILASCSSSGCGCEPAFLRAARSKRRTGGTPQGAGISPLLANIYLHYILDLWTQKWRHRHARGRIVIVRYADDCAPRRREGGVM
ncbi:reverse transcriptase domain-containing protein [Bradyrhizobium yuanmingense]|nr:reverse transcriptase domain-containing protein [Bradyrhizobium yuanmingense]MDF0523243.1 reverse transcriptase domain-containing protein [Bradyrhizobium yuanmingense]